MRILLTGAGGHLAGALAPVLAASGHDLVATDLAEPGWCASLGVPFRPHDLTSGDADPLSGIVRGADLVVHTPAYHAAVHVRSDREYWALNVDGTRAVLQAMRDEGVRRIVYLSSQAWHAHYDPYGFTKRLGEELLEYQRVNAGMSYAAVRPGDFTPEPDPIRETQRLLSGGVLQADVVDVVARAVAWIGTRGEGRALVVDAVAVPPGRLPGEDLRAALERLAPGSAELAERLGLDLDVPPFPERRLGWDALGIRALTSFDARLASLG
jgi:hypothetical protein